MGNSIAFQACGRTYKANVTTSPQTITISSDSPCNQLYVCVPGNASAVYLQVSSNVSANVTAPNNSTSSYAAVFVPLQQRVITIPQQFSNTTPMYISFVGDANTTAYLTPGDGL